MQFDFSLPGHPSTPFVISATTATTTSGTPLLLLVGLADGGVTGRLVKGLVFSHTSTSSNPLLSANAAAAAGPVATAGAAATAVVAASGAVANGKSYSNGNGGVKKGTAGAAAAVPALPGRQVLPWGWSSRPKLGWDGGEGFLGGFKGAEGLRS